MFKQKLKVKCEYYGINYIEVDETYTSQTCSVCGDVSKNNKKHRGLYVCKKCGFVANADVNGALNILKKVAPESVRIGGSGLVNRPVRISVVEFRHQTPHEAPSVRGCLTITGNNNLTALFLN